MGLTGTTFMERPAALVLNPANMEGIEKLGFTYNFTGIFVNQAAPAQGPNTSMSSGLGFGPLPSGFVGGRIALLSGTSTAEQMATHAMGALSLFQYLQARFEEAGRNPKDDLLGLLAEATGADDDALTVEESVSILLQLIIAGNESTGRRWSYRSRCTLSRGD
jgi:hypothetical protein